VGELFAGYFASVGEPGPEGLVFTPPEGGPLNSRNSGDGVWLPALDAAGLPASLRRRFSEGANPKQVQCHLGRSSITVTMDNYGHLFSGDVEALAERMDARIRRTGLILRGTQTGRRAKTG
jgi:integrase